MAEEEGWEGCSRRDGQATPEFRPRRREGSSSGKSQRESIPGGRNPGWRGAPSGQLLCALEERALTAGESVFLGPVALPFGIGVCA